MHAATAQKRRLLQPLPLLLVLLLVLVVRKRKLASRSCPQLCTFRLEQQQLTAATTMPLLLLLLTPAGPSYGCDRMQQAGKAGLAAAAGAGMRHR
jgi:hypothetical protein